MMDNQNTSQPDIDLIALLRVLKGDILSIMGITLLVGVLSLAYSFSLPDQYASNATLEFVNKGQSMSSMKGGGLSSQAIGMLSSFTGSSGNQQSEKLIKKINSRDFIRSLIEYESFMPLLMGIDSYNSDTKMTNYNPDLVDLNSGKWKKPLTDISISSVQRSFKSSVKLSIDQSSNLLNLTVYSKSPKAALSIAKIIIEKINEISRVEALNDANKSIDYLVTELANTSQNDIRSAISQLISSQLSMKMLANTSNEYALKIFDQPFLPEHRSSPNRILILMLGTFSGFIFGILFSIIMFYKRTLVL
jgi:uncharacterized protein involved in exopolysaccharide biosynthesis